MPISHRKSLVLAGVAILLLCGLTAAGIAAYAIYDQRQEIHSLQARLALVGQRSERAAQATRGLCSALAVLRKPGTSDIAALVRLSRSDCTPILQYPAPR